MREWLELDLTKRAISYTRFSHPSQALGDTLRRQVAAAARVAELYGLDLDTSLRFVDLGISAFRGRNNDKGALREVIDAMEAGALPIGIKLIVENIDRISRQNPYDGMGAIRRLCDLGVVIITASDMQVYSRARLAGAPDAGFVLQGMLLRAHRESADKAARIRDARESNRQALRADPEKGRLPRMVPGWLRVVDGKVVEIPHRVEVLKLIYEWAAAGVGSTTIAKRLNREGHETFHRAGQGISDKRAASGWAASAVGELLRSEAPRGYWQPHTRDPKTGKRVASGEPILCYPVIIDDTTWHAVQALVEGRDRMPDRTPGSARLANLVSGLVTCAACGGRVSRHIEGTRQGPRPFLVCDAARRAYMMEGTRVCFGVKRHPYQQVEAAILTCVAPLLATRARTSAPMQISTAISQAMRDVAISKDETGRLARKVNRLTALDEDDPLLTEALAERKAAMARLRQAEGVLLRAKSTEAAMDAVVRAMGGIIAQVAAGDEDARARMRDILRDHIICTASAQGISVRIVGTQHNIEIDRERGLDLASLDRLLEQVRA